MQTIISCLCLDNPFKMWKEKLNSGIENASKWYQDNFLIANKDKYQAMVIKVIIKMIIIMKTTTL